MLKTGKYRISYYDKYGGRLKDLESEEYSLVKVKLLAEKNVKSIAGDYKEVTSFTIDRRIFNSLD